MTADNLSNLIRREVTRGTTGLHPTCGVVTSYDPKKHAVKVTHQPDGNESGWMPILCAAAGKKLSAVHGPSAGDQAIIGYLNGDRESPFIMGFIHSDQDPPPEAKSGETIVQHTQNPGQNQTRTTYKVDKDGVVTTTTTKDNASVSVTTSGKGATVNTTTTGENSSVTTATQGKGAGVSTTTQGDNASVTTTTQGTGASIDLTSQHSTGSFTADQTLALNGTDVDVNS